jgi:hypothetical protein
MNELAHPLVIPDGADLLEALRVALSGDDGWVQAVGQVEDVELRLADEGSGRTRAWRGRFTLIAFGGPAGGPYMATLTRATSAGFELGGGALVRARASGVTAVLLPFFASAGVAAAVAHAPSTDNDTLPGIVAVTAPPVGGQGPGARQWAALAAASASVAREGEPPPDDDDDDDDDDDESCPERGDRVQHFAFGLCDVLMSSGESLKIRNVDGTGRVREIRVDKLTVLPPTVRDGKRVFKLVRRDG